MISFDQLREANVARCEQSYHPVGAWSPTDWACAAAGEMGEACNLIKKIRRGIPHEHEMNFKEAIANEIADTVIYLDLLAARLDINLGQAVATKFNATSVKVGSVILLTAGRST